VNSTYIRLHGVTIKTSETVQIFGCAPGTSGFLFTHSIDQHPSPPPLHIFDHLHCSLSFLIAFLPCSVYPWR